MQMPCGAAGMPSVCLREGGGFIVEMLFVLSWAERKSLIKKVSGNSSQATKREADVTVSR